jgi:hypothetical protein
MKALVSSIIVLGGAMFMLMSTTAMLAVHKVKRGKPAGPEARASLVNLSGRFSKDSLILA